MGALSDDAEPAPKAPGAGLTESERARTYGTALGLLFDATCVIDPELTVLECDAGFVELLERSEDLVVGATLPTLTLTGSLEGEPITLGRVAAMGSWRGHATLASQDGSELSLDALLVHDGADSPRIHLFLRDLRGPLSVQVGDVDHQDALTQMSRLSVLDEMASGIAHEMNQPLAAIVNYANGCLSLIKQERAEEPVLVRALTSIAEQSQRAAEIIRRMRAFARRSDGQRERFRLTDLLREAFEVSAAQRQRVGIELRCDFHEGHDDVVVDGIQVEQVVLHLVRNAVDSLSAQSSDAPKVIRVATRELPAEGSGQAYIESTVSDSGPPLDEEVKVRLFAPFQTTRRAGLGLGLVISRSIVEAHGGRLQYIGEGCGDPSGPAFSFTLPLRPAPIQP